MKQHSNTSSYYSDYSDYSDYSKHGSKMSTYWSNICFPSKSMHKTRSKKVDKAILAVTFVLAAIEWDIWRNDYQNTNEHTDELLAMLNNMLLLHVYYMSTTCLLHQEYFLLAAGHNCVTCVLYSTCRYGTVLSTVTCGLPVACMCHN